ncbi:nitroreductase family protein [Catenulispora sp. NF23]|uniref:Nitroreductase family protein n=1 Tax=Catenulispora pinistramenti TaxID=2705254 RepID=A0ABS5KVE4_9ACTN|nr:nitroreductase family protein [Catenulispora pinistramenti]MBS2534999.1 nitroreductase family protein [Catenulispora pinistramenti]MBS2549999.1 nitroreductase family protein [Catenulispora pinistramenti]
MTPDELLTTTRTVRRRLDLERPVPRELIEDCVRIALQAPSGSNRQTWQWLVVTDPDQRAAIGAVYKKACEAYLESQGAAGKLFADDPERSKVQQRVHDSVAYLADRMGDVPVLVLPCLKVAGGRLPSGNQGGLWGSLLPAAWSFCLAARDRGLGTAWTTLHLTYESEVAEILDLPDDVYQSVLLPTAYYTGDGFKPAPRQPVSEVLHWNRW